MEKHKEQVRSMLIDKWAEFQYKNELAKEIERYLIFDAPEHNIHLPIDGIWAICQEIEAELSEVAQYMNGTKVITPEIRTEHEGTTLITDAIYYIPSTKADLVKSVDTAIVDLMMRGRSWAEWKATFVKQ